jgi:hypothetical protein
VSLHAQANAGVHAQPFFDASRDIWELVGGLGKPDGRAERTFLVRGIDLSVGIGKSFGVSHEVVEDRAERNSCRVGTSKPVTY